MSASLAEVSASEVVLGTYAIRIAASDAERLGTIDDAVLDDILQQDTLVGRNGRVGDVSPVAATAVLCRDESGVDFERLDAEYFGDLVLDRLVDGMVVLVEEVLGPRELPCIDEALEELPALTVGVGFATMTGLCDAPELARTSTDDEVDVVELSEVCLGHVAVVFDSGPVMLGDLDGSRFDFVGDILFHADSGDVEGSTTASDSVE